MPNPVGGYRARIIQDSTHAMMRDALDALGWMDATPAHQAVNLVAEPVDSHEHVPFNTVAVYFANVGDTDLELGSNASEDRWFGVVDIYAEDEAIGRWLSHDVRDILRGKFPSIGRTQANVQVIDYDLATPVVVFVVDIENVAGDRALARGRAFEEFWWVVAFEAVDDYYDEVV